MIYISILAIITAVGLFIALYYIKVNLTSPLSLHCLAWFFCAITGFFSYDSFIEFPAISYYAFLIWYSIVYFILLVGEIVTLNVNSVGYFRRIECKCSSYWMLVIPISIYTIWEIYNVGNGGPASFFLNLRLANVIEDYEGVKFTVMNAVYPVMIGIFAIVCLSNTTKKNKYSILFWVVLFCIGTMGKFAAVTPILIFLTIKELTVGLNRKKLFVIFPILMCVMLTLHFIRMSAGDGATISSVLGLYIYSPILALSKLSNVINDGSGEYTFRFIFAFLYKMGFSAVEPAKTIFDYVYVPVPTNVFTVMQPFYQDFSLYGVVFGAILYGLIYSFMYASAKQGSPLSLLFYAVLTVSIFTSFFAETLITNLSGNIKLIICICILWRLTVKCKIKQ